MPGEDYLGAYYNSAYRVPPERYQQAWWELRRKVQGVAAPVASGADDFDPGAKYTSRPTSRTPATSWPTSCSSSSTARS